MDNSNSSNVKPLSYDSLKAILKYASLLKREEIYRMIPAYRKTDSLFPYIIDSVTLNKHNFKVNKRKWYLNNVYENEPNRDDVVFNRDELIIVPNKSKLSFEFNENRFGRQLNESVDDAFKKLFNEYLRNGTRLKKLCLWELPECLDGKDPERCKLHVSELKLKSHWIAAFQKIKPFIEHNESLKRIRFIVREETLGMFKEPLVKNSKELFLQFPYHDPVPLNDLLLNLQNPCVHVIYLNFSIDKVQELAANWIATRRSIGTSFILVIEDYIYVVDVFDSFKERLGATSSKITDFGTAFYANSVTLPISEESELVVFGGPMIIKWQPFKWTLRMEVMKRGSTVSK